MAFSASHDRLIFLEFVGTKQNVEKNLIKMVKVNFVWATAGKQQQKDQICNNEAEKMHP